MTRPTTRRMRLPALLIVLALLLSALPGFALAQDAEPLIYQSELLPAASSPGRIMTLTLEADGAATLSTDFLNDEEPIVEVGLWSSSEVDQTLSLTLSGTESADYETPIEIVFAVVEETLEAVEYDETLFGSEGLTLTLADAASSASDEIGADEELPADETPAGVYTSGALPAADAAGRTITLILADDGSATMVTEFVDEEPIEELGAWTSDADAGTVALTLSGRADQDYEVPVEILFSVEEDGALIATDYDETLLGSEGLTLTPVDESLESAAGVYVSDILPAADTPGQVVFMILYPNSAVQASTYYLNGEEPIQEVGQWEDNVDGSVTVVITGSIENEYDPAQELVFERDGDTLTYLSLQLTRLQEANLAQGPEPLAWYQTDVMPAASSPGLQKNLILFDDNTAQMISDYMNDEEPIIELGEWVDNDDGTLTVTLTGRADLEYTESDVIVFELTDDGVLTAIDYDETLYGSEGLTFAEQPLDDLELSAGNTDSGAVQGGDVAAGEPVTVTEATTATETGADLSSAELPAVPPFEVPAGATTVYVSEVLPAADTPGRVIRLVLFDDGSLQMVTDYLNGETSIIELGAYTDEGDGTLAVELIGQIDGFYEAPVLFTFEQTETGLLATEWDETLYGSEGLELSLEYQAE